MTEGGMFTVEPLSVRWEVFGQSQLRSFPREAIQNGDVLMMLMHRYSRSKKLLGGGHCC